MSQRPGPDVRASPGGAGAARAAAPKAAERGLFRPAARAGRRAAAAAAGRDGLRRGTRARGGRFRAFAFFFMVRASLVPYLHRAKGPKGYGDSAAPWPRLDRACRSRAATPPRADPPL